MRGRALQPPSGVNIVGHFTKPELFDGLCHFFGRRSKNHALAAAARQQGKNQTWTLGRSAVQATPHFEGAMPALYLCLVLLQNLKLGSPNK